MKVSRRADKLLGQPMFKMKQKIGDRDVIHMEIGDPDFDAPPNVRDKLKDCAHIPAYTHYCSSWGLPSFLRAIQDATLRSRGFRPETNQVLVTPGANIGIFYAVYCCCEPGEEVLIPNPGFPTYEAAVIAAGCVPIPYNLGKDFKIDLGILEDELVAHYTNLVIINSPSNPTGAVTGAATLIDLYEVLETYNALCYSDEIYARMAYDGDFFSIASLDHCKDRVILSNGFSKAFAMTGYRLGALIAPPAIAEKMMLLLQTTQSCVPPFIQKAGQEAIEGEQTAVEAMMTEYKKRRNLLVAGLNKLGLTCPLPGGAFYAFPRVPTGWTSEQFVDAALAEGLAILPGTGFGSQGEGYVRLCYATSRENIEKALTILRRIV